MATMPARNPARASPGLGRRDQEAQEKDSQQAAVSHRGDAQAQLHHRVAGVGEEHGSPDEGQSPKEGEGPGPEHLLTGIEGPSSFGKTEQVRTGGGGQGADGRGESPHGGRQHAGKDQAGQAAGELLDDELGEMKVCTTSMATTALSPPI